MATTFDSIDVTLGTITVRMDTHEKDINECHTRQRELTTRIDALMLHADDCRSRIVTLEEGQRRNYEGHYETAKHVELLKAKLDDLEAHMARVVAGQLDILNSNATTREQFAGVLASQDRQHTARMKKIRTAIYIGGGFLFIASQIYAKYAGSSTVLDALMAALGIPRP